jgi:flagellar motor switch protein FliN/FliY
MSDDDQTDGEGDGAGGAVNQADVDSMFDEAPAGGDAAPQGMGLEEIEAAEGAEMNTEQNYEIGEPMASDVTAIYEIPVQISAVLGRSTMQVSQLLKLGRGAVVELDRKVGEAIDIYVNNRLVARGEVVVVEDKLGVTMTEIVKSDRA